MVGIVTGSGLGLDKSALQALGDKALLGNSGQGKAGESIYLNASNGNLIIRDQDEMLMGLGGGASIYRSYNSQDATWREGASPVITGLTGTLNTAGSTVTRIDWDGSSITYTWDSTRAAYVSALPGAARQEISGTATRWTLRDNTTHTIETYDATLGGRLLSRSDIDGNTTAFDYNAAGLLAKVTTASHEVVTLAYDASNRLVSISSTYANASGTQVTATRTRYSYDAQGRLSKVTVDLTPEDGVITDGNVYTTTYTYDGDSSRIAAILNPDGSSVAFAYTDGRIATVTEITASGKSSATARYTNPYQGVDQPLIIVPGDVYSYSIDTSGHVTTVSGPSDAGFKTFTYDANGRVIRSTDPQTRPTMYTYDADGNLLRTIDSFGNVIERTYGSHDELLSEWLYKTAIVWDDDGNFSVGTGPRTTQGFTRYAYDAEQHLRFSISAEGRVTEMRYNASGQQVSRIAYTDALYPIDPTANPTEATESTLTAWLATIDKSKSDRTDITYDFRGQVSNVTRYATNLSDGTGNASDSSGLLQTRFIYDNHGFLIQRFSGAGASVLIENDTYDSLGRIVSTTAANGAVTVYQYSESSRTMVQRFANGLVRTSTYDSANRLLSVVDSGTGMAPATTTYTYDFAGRVSSMTDPDGGVHTYGYNTMNLKVAEVDPLGVLSIYRYDNDGRVVLAFTVATPVGDDVRASVQSGARQFQEPGANDRQTWYTYDPKGRLLYTVGTDGTVTQNDYDDTGRLVRIIERATRVATPIGPSSGYAFVPSESDRITHLIYDKDGLLVGRIDGEGYLTETRYNASGQRIETIAYATAVPTNLRDGTVIAALRPSATASDIHATYVYDDRGLLLNELDGEGHLTTYTYDSFGNVASRSQGVVAGTGGASTPVALHFTVQQLIGNSSSAVNIYVDGVLVGTVNTLPQQQVGSYDLALTMSRTADHVISFTGPLVGKCRVTASVDGKTLTTHTNIGTTGFAYPVSASQLLVAGTAPTATDVTTYTYDAQGRVLTSTVRSADRADNTTTYTYDLMGNLVTTRGPGRSAQYRYDLEGRIIARLDARGVDAIDALGASPTAAQVDAVWSQWATHLTYDAAGFLTSQTDASGARTVFFYDAEGRLKAQVNALGEASSRDYDAFGNVTRTVSYGTRLSAADTASLTGGIYSAAVAGKLATIDGADASITTLSYTASGRLAETDGPLGHYVRYTYDAFGDVTSTQRDLDATHTTRTDMAYDRVGNLVSTATDAAGLNLITRNIRDAFGRIVESVDARGVHRTWTYDRVGNVIAMADGTSATTHATYDALGRVLSRTDGTGHTTTYQYLYDGGIKTTTPEGIVTTQVLDANGQTVSITDGSGRVVRYTYDSEGDLLTTANTAGTESRAYDKIGHVIRTTDGAGHAVAYAYDAVGRVLTRRVDPDGLNLTTTYAYDARGNIITTTDPAGRKVSSHYDLENHLVSTVTDEGGLNLTTTFAYDADGHVVRKTEGNGGTPSRVTAYTYDGAGRLVSSVVDPDGLKLTTTYAYDGAGNVVSRAEGDAAATLRVTQFAYDGEGRVTSAIVDPSGLAITTRYAYDADGRIIAMTDAAGASEFTAYDNDGRVTYTVDTLGAVTLLEYDASNNVVRRTSFAKTIDLSGMAGTPPTRSDIASRVATDAHDRVTRYAYDASNRLRFTQQPNGQVIEQVDDATGNVVRSVTYTQAVSLGADFSEQAVAQAVAAAPGRTSRYVYDGAGRLAFSIDPSNMVVETTYDGLDLVGSKSTYLVAFAGAGAPSIANMVTWRNGMTASRHVTTYFHDGAGRTSYTVDAGNYVKRYDYDALGNVVLQRVFSNKLSTFTSATRPADIEAQVGASGGADTSTTYDKAGRAVSVHDALGWTTIYQLDALGETTGTIEAAGTADEAATQRTYDAAGNMTSESHLVAGPGGTTIALVTGYVYDAMGRRTQVIDPRGMRLADRANNDQDVLALRKALGIVDTAGEGKAGAALTATDVSLLRSYFATTTDYDASGQVVAVHAPYGNLLPGGPTVATTRTEYDAFGDAIKVTDARGGVGYFYFDASGQVVGHVDPAGYYTRTTRDLYGNVTRIDAFMTPVASVDKNTPPAGTGNVATTVLSYDVMNRVLSTTDATGGVESYTYDLLGNRVSLTNKLGGTTTYTFDERGNVQTETLPITTRNAAGNTIAVSNYYSYNAQGHRVLEDRAVGAVEEAYTVLVVDNLGRTTATVTYGYDASHHMVQLASTQNVLDGRGNVIYTMDATGAGTRYYYDQANRIVTQVSASGAQTRYEYDAAGNRIRSLAYLDLGQKVTFATLYQAMPSIPGAGARQTLYTYDAANRLIGQLQPNVTTAQAVGGATSNANFQTATGIRQSWVYDANGELVSRTDGTGHVSRTWYDALGRAILSIDANGYATAWTRDANGNVLKQTRYATRYTGDPSSITDPTAPPVAAMAGSDRITDYTYDANGRMLTQTVEGVSFGTVSGSGSLSQSTANAVTSYAYDAAGNLLRQTDANGSLFSYTYDVAGRKTGGSSPSFTDYAGHAVQVVTSYVYDAHGNVTRETRSGGSGGTDQVSTYVYDAAGHLLATTNAAGYTTNMVYDSRGNMVTLSNRLTGADGVSRDQVVTITYDAENREVSRITTLGGVSGVVRRTRYNAFGEVTGRGVGDTYQEVTDYDLAGRVLRTNADQGRSKIYLYDGNGNATLAVEAQGTDLMALDLLSPLGETQFTTLFAVPQLAWTLTVYDGLNHVVDVIQPTMDIHTAYLGLAAQQVPGDSPGQISVDVGGPTGPSRALPGIDGANLLGTTPGGNVGTATASMHWEHAANWTYMPSTILLNLDVPDLTSVFGAYSITITIGSKVITRSGGAISLRNESMPIPADGPWNASGGDVSYTMTIAITPVSTGATISLSQFSGKSHITFSSTPQSGYIITGAPNPVSLAMDFGSAKLKLSTEDSAHINAGAYKAQVYMRPWGSTGAYTAYGVAGGTPATVDISGLQSGAYYEVLYMVEDTSGNLVRSEQYQLLAGSSAKLTYGPYQQPGGAYAFLSGGSFVITNNSLVATDLRKASGDKAKQAVLYYRPMGSTGGFNVVGDYNNFVRGASMFSLGGIAAGNYEVKVYLYDDSGAAVNELDGSMSLGGSPSISLAYPRPADNNITLKNLPPTASTASIVFTNQQTGQTVSTGNLAISTPGTLAWAIPQSMFDMSGSSTNWTMTVTLSDSRVQPPTAYTATGTITVGTGRPRVAFGVSISGNVYTLNFSPTGANSQPVTAGQFLVLRYWKDGDDIVNHPERIQRRVIQKSPSGAYQWDSIGLDPNTTYIYNYDVYATQAETQNEGAATSLARSEGRFQPKNTPANQEAHWVVTGINDADTTVHRRQGWDAFGEIVSETDGNGNTTSLAYNNLGKLTRRTEALVQVTYANGYTTTIRPQTSYVYDLAGRQVALVDANGNVTTQSWNNALDKVAMEFHADGGVVSHQYDALGNERVRIAALGASLLGDATARRTDYTYDSLNRLTRADGPAVNGQRSFDTYAYDEQNRRITHTNTLGTDTVAFDVEGNVSATTSAMGRTTTYTTVWNASANGGKGAWVLTTTLPSNMNSAFAEDHVVRTLVDTSNSFGQVLSHIDAGGHSILYSYYFNGLLKTQGNSAYTYYNNGLVKTITDDVTGIREAFEYDNNGNVTFDGLTNRDGSWAFQQSVSVYDSLNRLVKVTDPRYLITYEYDAMGNRIHMNSKYNDALGNAGQVQDYWYEYDMMNRFTVTMGQLANGVRGTSATDSSAHVTAGASGDGINIGYDAFGQRVSATYAYDGHNEHYDYDAGGYLTTTTIRNGSGAITGTAVRTNDLAGRVTHYVETTGGQNVQDIQHYYDADNLLLKDVDNLESLKAGHEVGTTTDRLADGTVKDTRTYGQATVTTTTYNYVWYDSAKQSEIHIQASNESAPSWKPGLSKFVYDSEGRLVSAIDVAGKRAFSYQVDAEGRILRRDELLNAQFNADGTVKYGEANRQHTYYYMDGNQIGNIGNDGPERIDYARELAEHMQQTANKDDSHKRFTPVAFADFDANYQPINSTYPASAPSSYIVHSGDTLTGIAQAIWGDSSLWWMLADANNLTLDDALVPNTVLTVPNKVTNIHNNSSTVRPYDPGIAIGDTQPTLPDPPPPPPAPKQHGGGCGGALQIIAIVVAVVVTIYTAGAAAALLSEAAAATATSAGVAAAGTAALAGSYGVGIAIAAGAVGGAVGSIAAQGTLIAGGAQSSIDWKGVAIGAVGGAVTAGVGSIPVSGGVTLAAASASSFGSAVTFGATAAAGTAVADSVLGLQAFNWRDVAAGAVASGASYGAGRLTSSWNIAAQRLATGFAAGAGSAAVHGNLSQSWQGIATNVVANTIGNAVMDGIVAQQSEPRQPESDQDPIVLEPMDFSDDVRISADDIRMRSLPPMAPVIVSPDIFVNLSASGEESPTIASGLLAAQDGQNANGSPVSHYSSEQNALFQAGFDAASAYRRDQVELAGVSARRNAAAASDAAVSLAIQQKIQSEGLEVGGFFGGLAIGGIAGGIVTVVSPVAAFGLSVYGTVHGSISAYEGYKEGDTPKMVFGGLEAVGGAFGLRGSAAGITNAGSVKSAFWNPTWTTNPYSGLTQAGDIPLGQRVSDAFAPPREVDPGLRLRANQIAGADFQARAANEWRDTLDNVVEEVSIRPFANGSGELADFRVRVDGMGQARATESTSSATKLFDAKASESAPLTANQKKGYPLIEEFGGTVVGKGGEPHYPRGTVIPPTKVTIIRPSNLPEGY